MRATLWRLLGWMVWLGLGLGPTAHALTPLPDAQSAAESTQRLQLDIQLHGVSDDRRRPLEKLTRQALSAVQTDLQTWLAGELHVDFVGSPEIFAQVMEAHKAFGWPESWISGLALLDQDRIIVHVNGPGALLTPETVRHELAHVAIHALTEGKASLPRWYHEGVATWLAGEDVARRLREGLPETDSRGSLADLDLRFRETQKTVQTAYATSANFIRFALARAGNTRALWALHARMRAGLDFDAAWTATFGMSPAAQYELFGAMTDASDPEWLRVMADNTLWSFASVLAMVGLVWRWRRRPQVVLEDGPLDLEGIAREGDLALRPWLRPGFQAAALVPVAVAAAEVDTQSPEETADSAHLTAAVDTQAVEHEPLLSEESESVGVDTGERTDL